MAQADEGLEGKSIGRVVGLRDSEGTFDFELNDRGREIFFGHRPPGGVDDGPDLWAVALAAGIVSMAIAMAILVGSLI